MEECKRYYKHRKKLDCNHEKEHLKENRNETKVKPPPIPTTIYKKETLCTRHKERLLKQPAESQKRSTNEKIEKSVDAQLSAFSVGGLSPRSSDSCYTPKPRQAHQKRERGGTENIQELASSRKDATHCHRRAAKEKPASSARCPSLSLELLSPWASQKSYTLKKRSTYTILPSLVDKNKSKGSKPTAEGANGDRLLYKNSTFGLDLSASDSDSDTTVKTTKLVKNVKNTSQNKLHLEDKDSSPLVKSAREQCKKMNDRFKTKCFQDDLLSSDCESRKTTISCKSADNLRTVVCSQIKIQEIIDETTRKLNKAQGKRYNKLKSMELSNSSEDLQEVYKKVSRSKPKTVEQPKLGSTLDILSDDVVSPLVRKVQRMYLKTLNEEMSLLEDLEQLPVKCNKVFQPTTEDEEEEKDEQ
ncbi:hypothetical protein KR044_007048 [Drosophila immigrans]|nr:hypothetical protein KR044_007048 [Drosophila immigrans]